MRPARLFSSGRVQLFASNRVQLFAPSVLAWNNAAPTKAPAPVKTAKSLAEVTGHDESLIGPGATPGTIPTDLDQATGLERFELLGNLEGVDVFDMENPIREGLGTPEDPYLVPSYFGQRYVGCKGKDNEEHNPYWMLATDGELARCWQCGTCYTIKYLGDPAMDHH